MTSFNLQVHLFSNRSLSSVMPGVGAALVTVPSLPPENAVSREC